MTNSMAKMLRWLFVGEKRRNYHGNEVQDASRFAIACVLFSLSIGPLTLLVWLGLVVRALLGLSR